jgi:CysZ protein
MTAKPILPASLASARNLVGEPLSGPAWLLRGYRLLLRPGIRGFMLIPLLGNMLLFALGAAGAFYGLDAAFDRWLPEAAEWLRYVLYPIAALLLLVLAFFTATLVGNLLLAPFNGLLADRVERALTGTSPSQDNGERWTATMRRALRDELRKLAYILPRLLLVFVLGWIPFVGVIAVPIGLVLGAWLLALEFAGNPLGNWGYSFADQRAYLRARPGRFIGFGFSAMGAALLPVFNFALIPASIAGMTAMCLELRRADAAALPAAVDTPPNGPPPA